MNNLLELMRQMPQEKDMGRESLPDLSRVAFEALPSRGICEPKGLSRRA